METHEKARVHIRWAIRRDMPNVVGIENASSTNPWSEEEFLLVLRQRNCIGMVAEQGDRVVGFMIYKLHRDRIVVLNFAVDPDLRRQGVGHKMIEKLKTKLNANRRTKLEFTVRETDLGGLLFLKNQGFRAVEMVRGHFTDSGEDAILMTFVQQSGDCVSDENPHKPVNRVFRHASGEISPW